MKLSTTTIRQAALAALAAAVLVPTAQASVRPDDRAGVRGGGGVTVDPSYVRALEIRGTALNEKYRLATVRPDDRAGVRGVDAAYVRALEIRGKALNEQFGVRPDDRAGVRDVGPYARALNVRGEALNEQHRVGSYFTALDARSRALNEQLGLGVVRPDDRAGIRAVDTEPVVVPTGRGFDWSDAGIGALAAFGACLLGGGGALVGLRIVQARRRHPVTA